MLANWLQWRKRSKTANTLLTSLVSHWRLEEASGNRLDAVGGHTLTAYGAPVQIEGRIGNCLDFDPETNDYLGCVGTPFKPLQDNFTITAWVNFDMVSNTGIIGRWSANNKSYLLGCDGTYFTFQTSEHGVASEAIVTDNTGLDTGIWYFLRAWYSKADGKLHLCLNEKPEHSAAFGGPAFAGNAAFEIGRESAGPTYFSGRVDEVSFWRRILTTAEAAKIYNAGAGKAYPWI